MKGDFSRFTFNAKKQYVGTLMQQGRVQLDADWNEQQAIHRYHRETSFKDVIGPTGVPRDSNGFEIRPDLYITKGRIYVDGILCENNEDDMSLSSQVSTVGLKTGRHLVYLDVWERHVSAIEAPELLEKALGGVDTTTRVQIVWRIRLDEVAQDATCEGILVDWKPDTRLAKMNAQTTAAGNASPCEMTPVEGYKGLGNQLYRVEVHQGGSYDKATIKWSRDNGTVVTSVNKIEGTTLFVENTGRDEVLGFDTGQWVELIDREGEFRDGRGLLFEIDKIDHDKREITVKNDYPNLNLKNTFKQSIILRRWDNSTSSQKDGIPVKDGPIKIEDAIEVDFEKSGAFRSGDYWLIPARNAMGGRTGGEIEWPSINGNPAFKEPDGIKHHYCPLALVDYDKFDKKFSLVNDCRELFPPLTNITAEDVSFDNNVCKLSGATTVQDAIEGLCRKERSCECVVTVKPGELKKILNSLNGKDSINICLMPGVHKTNGIDITGNWSIRITGSGASTIVVEKGKLGLRAPVIIIRDVNFNLEEDSSIYLEMNEENSRIDVSGCRFIRVRYEETTGPLVTVGGEGHLTWIGNWMRACRIDKGMMQALTPEIPEVVRNHIKMSARFMALGQPEEAYNEAMKAAEPMKEVSYRTRTNIYNNRPEREINELSRTQPVLRFGTRFIGGTKSPLAATNTVYDTLKKRELNVGVLAGAFNDFAVSAVQVNDVALALESNTIGGWIKNNRLEGNVVLMSVGGGRLSWGDETDKNKIEWLQSVSKSKYKYISFANDLTFSENDVNSVVSFLSKKVLKSITELKTIRNAEGPDDFTKFSIEGFRSLTIRDNTFQENESSFVGYMVLMSGNRYMGADERSENAAYVLGNHGIFVGNIATHKKYYRIRQIFTNKEDSANLIRII